MSRVISAVNKVASAKVDEYLGLAMSHVGLNSVDIDSKEVAYFDDSMLKDNVVFFVTTHSGLEPGHDGGETLIKVKHATLSDASEFEIYSGSYLSPIQVYAIITDVFDMYNSYPLDVFMVIVDELSLSSLSPSAEPPIGYFGGLNDEIRTSIAKVKAKVAA